VPGGPSSTPSSFADLGLDPSLVRALSRQGIDAPFAIQAATLPDSLTGRDVLGRGRTGSGKTLAFALPLVSRLAAAGRPRRGGPTGLVLLPTRELATQVAAVLGPLAEARGLRHMTVFGGVPEKAQIRRLAAGVDIVVACPGRLRDLVDRGHADLSGVQVTVLDEADHMADLGFLPVVRALLDATPSGGQRLLFSATLDRGVDVLVKRFLTDPVVHSVVDEGVPSAPVAHHVLQVSRDHRVPVVADLLSSPGRTVVFTRTKRGARTMTKQLRARGVEAVELHGDLSQGARTRNLAAFSSGQARALVATDIAARGIHVDDVSLVIHADPPAEHKAYVHRSGRTARAGAGGTVVTMMVDDQLEAVRDLMRRGKIQPDVRRVSPRDAVLTTIASGGAVPAGTALPTTGPDHRPARTTASRSTQGSRARRPRTRGPRAATRPHSAAGFSSGRAS
jgi:superfamily II DNA/RNA helicase